MAAQDVENPVTLPVRLRQAQQDVDDAESALRHRRLIRRRLVVEALDAGAMSQRQVAAALGKGTGLVHKLLVQDAQDDEG